MIRHSDFEDSPSGKDRLRRLIEEKALTLGGNAKLKIYGRLSCKSGKRMLKKNRVFFHSEKEAIKLGYRSCGHCMKDRLIPGFELRISDQSRNQKHKT